MIMQSSSALARVRLPALAIALFAMPATAQELGGGANGSHGRTARFQLEQWIAGTPTQFSFENLPPAAILQWGALAFSTSPLNHPALTGTLLVDTASPTLSIWGMGTTAPITMPAVLNGSSFYIQGLYFDTAMASFVLTDATKVNIHDPLTVVGTGVSRTLELYDEAAMSVTQTLTGSRNGRLHFTPDRTRAYVSQSDSTVRLYTATLGGFLNQTGSFPLTHRPRSGKGAVSRDGSRLYLPAQEAGSPYQNFILVCDINPASPTYNTEINVIPVPVIGPGAGPGNGPEACAISPDGNTLYIAYAQVLPTTGPNAGKASVGVLDLTAPGQPLSEIPITVGGNIAGIHVSEHIEISEDGHYVYSLEQAFDPALPLINGFSQGALLSVIATFVNAEITTIPTHGLGQFEFAIDLLDRDLWIGQINSNYMAEAICVDIDRNSPTRFSIVHQVSLDPTPGYSPGNAGPMGIAITPDGSRVVVAVDGDPSHGDMIATIDAHAGTLLGTTAITAADAETVSIQRY